MDDNIPGDKVQKTAVVTGASSGIGLYIARGLARQGYRVILVCRDELKAAQALEKIGREKAEVVLADLSSQRSVRQAAEQINMMTTTIEVLVNNAGGVRSALMITEDDFEWQFAVNHLAPFLLTGLLLDRLLASGDARIINMSSRAHARGYMHFNDLNLSASYSISGAYNQSKLANLLFTYELAERLKGRNVTVNAMHPGLVRTSFGNKQVSFFHDVVWSVLKLLGSSPERAADTAIFLATSDEVKGVSGKYFFKRKEVLSSKASYDKEISGRLWDISQNSTGYPFSV